MSAVRSIASRSQRRLIGRWLAVVLLLGMGGLRHSDPVLAQPGGGPPPHSPQLSRAAQAVATALKKQGQVAWQGERVITICDAAGNPKASWTVRDGFDGANLRTGYFFTAPTPGAQSVSVGPVRADATIGGMPLPWMQGIPPHMGARLGLGGGPPERLEGQLAHFAIEVLPDKTATDSTLTGSGFRIRPAYPGGFVELLLDGRTGLPAQVERFGADHKLRYRSTYRSLQANVSPREFWFADAVQHPENRLSLPPPPWQKGDGPGQRPGRGIAAHLLMAFAERRGEALAPPGFRFVEGAELQSAPFPIFRAVVSDGLNPLNVFIVRLPKGMGNRRLEAKIAERLAGNPDSLRAPHRTKLRGNWLMLVAGEVGDDLLDETLGRVDRRLQRGIQPPPAKGENGGPRPPRPQPERKG